MKIKKILTLCLSTITFLTIFSCNKTANAQDLNNSVSYGIPIDYGTEYINTKPLQLDENNFVSYSSLQDYFKLDYTKQSPDYIEEVSVTQDKNQSSEKSESVIPPSRELSKYKTKYFAEPKSTKRPKLNAGQSTTINTDSNIASSPDFFVQDWGPSSLVSENEKPSFYVVFSKPVKPLTALGKEQNSCEEMSISPKLKGKFKWFSSDYLSFEAEETPKPATTYTITINKNLLSLSGQKISGQTIFTTESDGIKILSLFAGYEKDSNCTYSAQSGALPPNENRFYIRLNYQLTKAEFDDNVIIKVQDKNVKFTSQADYSKNFNWKYLPKSDKSKNRTNSFIVTINDKVLHNQQIKVSFKNESTFKTYSTLKPFELKQIDKMCNYSQGKKAHPLSFTFSQTPDLASLVKNLSVENFTISKDNIEINNNTVTLFNLPLEFNHPYTLTINKELQDIYGQKIQSQQLVYNFATREVKSYVNYIDNGAKIMEAQFPHKIIFEHQNLLDGSYYVVEKTDKPLKTNSKWNDYDKFPPEEITKNINNPKENQRNFEEIDLEPYLNNGYGFVRFEAHSRIKQIDWKGEPYVWDNSNVTTIQVTDLAVTARIGINKAVFMVRSLKDGKPVENAKITLCCNEFSTQSKTTDSKGLCIIDFTEEDLNIMQEAYKKYYDNMNVLVEKGDDKMIFYPRSHNTWAYNIYSTNLLLARNAFQRTFMFVDRGLYNPGETVTFKGIDKNQIFGNLETVQTEYTIDVQETYWNSKNILPTITGTTSENGSFHGTIKLPDNIKPGNYKIKYTRNGSKTAFYTYFKIAYFEKALFESSTNIENKNYIGGDSISAELSASYLGGGSLSNAEYETTWYKQPSYFTPNSNQTKAYTFSNTRWDSYRNIYHQENSSLNSNGTATLKCTSQKITNGRPYTYKVESYVTDVSNQRIATSTDVLVHPANYYVGIAKPVNLKGFAKSGQKIKFPYILVDTKANVLSKDESQNFVSKLEYSLNREEWTVVNAQSVDDTVYTRYQSTLVEESKGKVNILPSGLLEVCPKECGWYTLTINGKDNKGNVVITDYSFYVSGSSSYYFNTYNSQSIKLTPDQNEYNPGDTAQILLESPLPSGDYLITVEREGIFSQEVKHFDCPSNIIDVPISGTFVPVVYVSVSSYSNRTESPKHEYGQTDLDKPKDYYGITKLFVNPKVKAFTVKIESDKNIYKPGEEVTLTLTATKGGKPLSNAELTVMAVDRGVLDLIDYHVQDPIEFFYNEDSFPLFVYGGDSRALIMDPVTYSIKNLSGGDAMQEESKDDERKDFRPTAHFEPTLITDSKGQATCTFKMPDTLTTYRITAFGVKNDYFALKETEVKVQNAVNVTQVQPRRLRERDTAECGVLITNLQNKGVQVSVEAQVRNPTKNYKADEEEGKITKIGSAFIDGDKKHSVYVAPGQSSVVYFDIAAEKEGNIELVYTIKSDILNEKLVSRLKIEKSFVYETVATFGQTDNTENQSIQEQIVLPSFAKEGRGDVKFTLDATRLGVLGSSVNYLFTYPYGCMEQQSSKILPLVLFNEYIDIFGLDSEIKDIKKCVRSVTKDWGLYQKGDGGFPYWPEGTSSDFFVSLRIAHIYASAINRGYSKNDFSFNIDTLLSYIYKKSLDKTKSTYLKAYAIYVLKLNNYNQVDLMLNNLYENRKDLPLNINCLIALSYLLNDNSASIKKAKTIADEIRPYLQPSGRTVTVSQKDGTRTWRWYESNADELALIFKLFVSINPKDKMVDRLLISLLNNQKCGYWKDTNTTARVLDSIYTYIQKRELAKTDFTACVKLNNKQIMQESFKGANAKPKILNLSFEDSKLSSLQKDTAIPIDFSKTGQGYLFYTLEMKYAIPDELQISRDEGIGIEYAIFDYQTNEQININDKESSLLELENGKVYIAKIKVSSTRQRDYLALRCPIPSGAQILDSNFVTSGSQARTSSYSYWDNKSILDNEVQYFWDSFSPGTKEISFTFRTSRRGVYPTPPVQAECMYEPEFFGRSNGYLIQIK